jgi:CheY-like chemotaxis protein
MATAQPYDRPSILILEFEESIGRLLRMCLELESYDIEAVCCASDALAIVEHSRGTFIVLMDNFHVNKQAKILAKKVFGWPGLHRRVKIIGIAANRNEHLLKLDVFLRVPLTVVDLLSAVERMCAVLQTGNRTPRS